MKNQKTKQILWMVLLILFTFGMGLTSCSDEQAKDHGHKWGYTGDHGPEHWEGDCRTGKKQSPINIVSKEAISSKKLAKLRMNYKNVTPSIINNGHTIQVNYPEGSTLAIGNKTYKLLQFHFHTKSEHAVNGKLYELEMHLVHKNDNGQLAVVGILFKIGKENSFLSKIWSELPKSSGETKTLSAEINAKDVLPRKLSYYTYSGSLTTPPCSEGVRWLVIRKISSASSNQISEFTKLFPVNNRPVQSLNGRKVKVKKR
ncbi:MAG: carbonic anhydrase family protein [Spirochaetota bacterium]|nr:carbonic anhydrase family protein [Spirochaetota bacterium]